MAKAKKPSSGKKYIYALGRRKTATARVRLFSAPTVPGFDDKPQLVVNDQPAEQYFPGEFAKSRYRSPFTLTETLQKMSASVKVEGSGKTGQLDATVHGIARALDRFNPDFHKILKDSGLLTRDSRAKERRKAGKGGKARRSKQSPKR